MLVLEDTSEGWKKKVKKINYHSSCSLVNLDLLGELDGMISQLTIRVIEFLPGILLI